MPISSRATSSSSASGKHSISAYVSSHHPSTPLHPPTPLRSLPTPFAICRLPSAVRRRTPTDRPPTDRHRADNTLRAHAPLHPRKGAALLPLRRLPPLLGRRQVAARQGPRGRRARVRRLLRRRGRARPGALRGLAQRARRPRHGGRRGVIAPRGDRGEGGVRAWLCVFAFSWILREGRVRCRCRCRW